jgi:hypothetical protein
MKKLIATTALVVSTAGLAHVQGIPSGKTMIYP